MAKRVLIFGSGSILTRAWVGRYGHTHEVTLVYSGEAPAGYAESVSLLPLSEGFADTLAPQTVVIVSAHIPTEGNGNGFLYEVNVALVQKIVARYRSAKIVFCSTVSVYPAGTDALTEHSLLQPQNTYALSKLWGEHIVRNGAKEFAVFRISSLAGTGMKENTFIPRIIHDALTCGEIVLLGDGQRLQNYIDAEELAGLLEKAISTGTHGLFLGVAPQSYSNRQVAEIVQRFLPGVHIRHEGTDTAAGYVFDARRTYGTLDYTPLKNLDTTILELIEWKKKRLSLQA